MKFRIYMILLLTFLLVQIAFTQQDITIKGEKSEDLKLYNKSYALIIGAINYYNGWPKLLGVAKDVDAVRNILEKQGFTVEVVLDPTSVQLDIAFKEFINKHGMDKDNRLLFYFAGHGHTVKSSYDDEMGFIVPVDAENPNFSKNNFLAKAMSMQQIEVYAKQIQSKHAMFVFDACFSGSIFAVTRAVPENISYKTAKPVRQFITSGSAEETVPDKSIFREQFVSALEGEADMNKDGFITGSELGEYLQDRVINYSKGNQHPQYGKISNPKLDKGDLVFKPDNAPTQLQNKDITRSEESQNIADRTIPNITKETLPSVKNENTDWKSEFEDMRNIFAKVALRTANGYYLCAGNDGEVNSKTQHIGNGEIFELIILGDKKVAFKTSNGLYLTAKPDISVLKCSAKEVGENEIFDLIELDEDKIALTKDGKNFLCAIEGGGHEIITNSKKILQHEVFSIVKLKKFATLKCYNEFFLSIDKDKKQKVVIDKKEKGEFESFEIVKIAKNKVAFKSKSGDYLRISDDMLTNNGSSIGQNETFEPVELPDGKTAFKAANGKYVTAVGGGGFSLKADALTIGNWQKFEVYLRDR